MLVTEASSAAPPPRVFRRYMFKPMEEPCDSTVAYIEAHNLVDRRNPDSNEPADF